MRMKEIAGLVRRAMAAFEDDAATLLSGAIAFYTLLSLAPLVLVAVWTAGLVFGEEQTFAQVVSALERAWGLEAATVAARMIERIRVGSRNPIGLVFGGAVLLYGASKVFVQLQAALNTIWNVREKPRTSLRGRVAGVVRKRIWSFAMILLVGCTLMTAMFTRTALVTVHRVAKDLLPAVSWAWQLADVMIGLALVTVLFAALFRVLPDAKIRWRTAFLGACITAVMFNFGSYLVSLYFAYVGAATIQGAAGSVMAILLWVYFSANAFFLGAEITVQIAETYDGGIEPEPHAERFVRVTAPRRN